MEKINFPVKEFPDSMDLDSIKKNIKTGGKNYTVLELTEKILKDFTGFKALTDFLYEKTKLICVTDNLNPAVKNTLIKCGIADCLTTTDSSAIASYIRILDQRENHKSGKFLILDDNTSHIQILSSIIKRFGYKTEFINNGESLYEKCTENNIEMVLVNLGTTGLDLNSIIRKSYGNSDIKKSPLICYKSMNEGLFVHELISGLHKITKVILSPPELFSFLTDILFKKEIITISAKLNKELKFEQYRDYSTDSISRIYYTIQENICSQESLCGNDTIENMMHFTKGINKTLSKVEGLRWLNTEKKDENKATCGEGA
jgi:CheY-like chemotaxis protein